MEDIQVAGLHVRCLVEESKIGGRIVVYWFSRGWMMSELKF